MAQQRIGTAMEAAAHLLVVPWSAFVGAFLYYAGLTLVAISGTQLPDAAMAAAYLLPAIAYGIFLLSRLVRAVAAVHVDIGHLALPRLQ